MRHWILLVLFLGILIFISDNVNSMSPVGPPPSCRLEGDILEVETVLNFPISVLNLGVISDEDLILNLNTYGIPANECSGNIGERSCKFSYGLKIDIKKVTEIDEGKVTNGKCSDLYQENTIRDIVIFENTYEENSFIEPIKEIANSLFKKEINIDLLNGGSEIKYSIENEDDDTEEDNLDSFEDQDNEINDDFGRIGEVFDDEDNDYQGDFDYRSTGIESLISKIGSFFKKLFG
jgi:hypothetical protein